MSFSGKTALVLLILAGWENLALSTESSSINELFNEVNETAQLDSTYRDDVTAVAKRLLQTIDEFKDVAINTVPSKGQFAVWIVKNAPKGSKGYVGNLERAKDLPLIIVNADYLDQLRAGATIYATQKGTKLKDLVLEMSADGVSSTAAHFLGPGGDWHASGGRLPDALFQGAVAFLLAHELGHMILRQPDASQLPLNVRPKPGGPSDLTFDRSLMCEDLVGPRVKAQREIEEQADSFAVGQIGKIPTSSPTKPRLLYEIGTDFLLDFEFARAQIAVATLLKSSEIDVLPGTVRADFDDPLLQRLRSNPPKAAGVVEQLFPRSHPSWYTRKIRILTALSQDPKSMDYGKQAEGEEGQMLDLIIGRACRSQK